MPSQNGSTKPSKALYPTALYRDPPPVCGILCFQDGPIVFWGMREIVVLQQFFVDVMYAIGGF